MPLPDAVADALRPIDQWGPDAVAAVFTTDGSLISRGDTERVWPVASITKLVSALAVLVAIEEGSLVLDEPAGPAGSTVRHLLCHASGLPFRGSEPIAAPGTRRIYSNTGYLVLAQLLAERTGMTFGDYAAEAVLDPLGMRSAGLVGGADAGLDAAAVDLIALGTELLSPTIIDRSTWATATTPQMGDLAGVLPGWGPYDPCPWGLGPEIRGTKSPHWTGLKAPSGVFGHFGAAGTFLWADPGIGIGCVVIAGRPFDSWAVDAWPSFSDGIRAAVTAR